MEQKQLEIVLRKNKEIRDEIYKKYKELNENEIELFKLITDKNYNYVYSEDEVITLKYYVHRVVDYDKLRKLYPEIYRDGLIETFSFDEAKKIYDSKIIGKVIRDCIIATPIQKLKYERKKSYKK